LKKLGLIINPIAGMGGSVGLKGTDGSDILNQCIKLGAEPESHNKTAKSISIFSSLKESFEIITCKGPMGESVIKDYAYKCKILDNKISGLTTPKDTIEAAKEMVNYGIDLLLFAGGDGTARDICDAVGTQVAVIGIPAGVKIHSAVFAKNPANAGELCRLFLLNKIKGFVEAEVMDIDEEDYRKEILSARLFGYLKIPFERKYLQNLKSGSPPSDLYFQQAIAHTLCESMNDDYYYIVGPGSTTKAFMNKLGLEGSLLGVDIVFNKKLYGKDLNAKKIIEIIRKKKSKLIITPVGGQGFILGRGNQQLSPQVINIIGKENIIIIATPAKLNSLNGRPLLIDTGEDNLNHELSDYYKLITGHDEFRMYKVIG